VGEENKIKKLGWRMEKKCPWKGNERKGKRESQRREVVGSSMVEKMCCKRTKTLSL
jgi:hypothetical protein